MCTYYHAVCYFSWFAHMLSWLSCTIQYIWYMMDCSWHIEENATELGGYLAENGRDCWIWPRVFQQKVFGQCFFLNVWLSLLRKSESKLFLAQRLHAKEVLGRLCAEMAGGLSGYWIILHASRSGHGRTQFPVFRTCDRTATCKIFEALWTHHLCSFGCWVKFHLFPSTDLMFLSRSRISWRARLMMHWPAQRAKPIIEVDSMHFCIECDGNFFWNFEGQVIQLLIKYSNTMLF